MVYDPPGTDRVRTQAPHSEMTKRKERLLGVKMVDSMWWTGGVTLTEGKEAVSLRPVFGFRYITWQLRGAGSEWRWATGMEQSAFDFVAAT